MTLQTLLLKPVKGIDNGLTQLGRQMRFYARSIGWTGRTVRRYKKEVVRLLAEVSLGTGALAVIGGTVGVIGFLAFFTGTEVGLQGYSALNQLGSAAFTGFVSAYFNTREIAPLVAGLALAATVGSMISVMARRQSASVMIGAGELAPMPPVFGPRSPS
jgi:phospholipid/cholesterol/gamma-HCH transport system permease protein